MGDTFAYSPGESAKSSNDVSLDRRRSFFSSGSPSSGEASTANLRDTRPSDGLAKPTRVASHERGLRYTPPAGRILAEGENFTRLNTVTYVPGLKCYPCPRIVPPEALSQSGEEAFAAPSSTNFQREMCKYDSRFAGEESPAAPSRPYAANLILPISAAIALPSAWWASGSRWKPSTLLDVITLPASKKRTPRRSATAL
jgi:hypothetical protein